MASPLYTSSKILESSLDLLDSSLRSLDSATRNVPRLKKILHTQKVFGLVPELDLESAKRNFETETHPQISYLVDKIEKEVARLKRKKIGLESKLELQHVRLQSAENNARDSLRGRGPKNVDPQKIARLKLLQNKKERLKYSLSRMNLQNTRARLSVIPSLPPQV